MIIWNRDAFASTVNINDATTFLKSVAAAQNYQTTRSPTKHRRLVSPVGRRLHHVPSPYHSGWDISRPVGTPVIARLSGEIAAVVSARQNSYITVVTKTQWGDILTYYIHVDIRSINHYRSALAKRRANKGTDAKLIVKAGDVIGRIGRHSAGAHLHLQMKASFDPQSGLPFALGVPLASQVVMSPGFLNDAHIAGLGMSSVNYFHPILMREMNISAHGLLLALYYSAFHKASLRAWLTAQPGALRNYYFTDDFDVDFGRISAFLPAVLLRACTLVSTMPKSGPWDPRQHGATFAFPTPFNEQDATTFLIQDTAHFQLRRKMCIAVRTLLIDKGYTPVLAQSYDGVASYLDSTGASQPITYDPVLRVDAGLAVGIYLPLPHDYPHVNTGINTLADLQGADFIPYLGRQTAKSSSLQRTTVTFQNDENGRPVLTYVTQTK